MRSGPDENLTPDPRLRRGSHSIDSGCEIYLFQVGIGYNVSIVPSTLERSYHLLLPFRKPFSLFTDSTFDLNRGSPLIVESPRSASRSGLIPSVMAGES